MIVVEVVEETREAEGEAAVAVVEDEAVHHFGVPRVPEADGTGLADRHFRAPGGGGTVDPDAPKHVRRLVELAAEFEAECRARLAQMEQERPEEAAPIRARWEAFWADLVARWELDR